MMMRARYQVQEWSQSSRHGDQRAVRLGSSFWLLRLLGLSCDIRPAYSSPVLWRSWLFSGWAEDYECSKELPRCVPACIQRHFHAMIYVCIRMCVCMHISVCIYIYIYILTYNHFAVNRANRLCLDLAGLTSVTSARAADSGEASSLRTRLRLLKPAMAASCRC